MGAVVAPLGLGYLASVLMREGYAVEILDCIAMDINQKELGALIKRSNADLVGITCLTPMAKRSYEAAAIVKENSDSKIVMGGAHASIFPYETLKIADFAVIGEGEYTMLDLVKVLESGHGFEKVKGIAYRDNDKFITNPKRPYITDMDSLPYPARDILPMEKYRPTPANFKMLPCHTMITSRGCPFNCVYCSKSVFGRKYRCFSPEYVVNEMEHLKNKFGAKEILFWDDVFTLNKKRTLEICDLILERNLNIPWTCESRVDCIDKNLLKKMEKAGCWQIGYGVESGDPDVLCQLKKKITLDQVRKTFKETKDVGISVRSYFMIGLPGENGENILKTINFAKSLDIDIAQFCITTPYPDTELYETAKKEGTLKSTDWSDFLMIPDNPAYITENLDEEELKMYLKRAYKNFYLRPSYVFKQIMKIRSLSDIKRHYNAFLALKSM